ncbi:MAG: hypothetical protein WA463_17680 [Terriglobales bacterium]
MGAAISNLRRIFSTDGNVFGDAEGATKIEVALDGHFNPFGCDAHGAATIWQVI